MLPIRNPDEGNGPPLPPVVGKPVTPPTPAAGIPGAGGNPGVVPPGLVPKAPTPAPVAPAPVAPVSTAPKAPTPAPVAPTPVTPKAPTSVSTINTPAAPVAAPVTSLTSPSGGQTSSAVGTPSGYSLTSGVNTSTSGLLPDNFSLSSLLPTNVPADAATPGANAYTQQEAGTLAGPTDWNVTAPQTVAGQYANLMSTGNPAIQAAEQSAIRANAANGGANSLMAQTAASMAGSQVALTIAQQDAQTYAAAGQYNATAANSFATAQNTFIQNATLSQQNFQQGVAMLKDQTSQSMQQLYAQVEANGAEASTSLKSQLDLIQANTNATLETMDKTFAQTSATNATQEQYAQANAAIGEGYNQANADQNYGMQVRLGYLSAVNTTQTALMNTIASIQSNPNINTTQAQAAVQQAVDQFNSFMTMNNAYYSAMVPTASSSNPSTYLPGFPTN